MFEKFGKIYKDEYYIKQVNSKHFMRKYQGFGISQKVLAELLGMGVIYVICVYTRVNGKKQFLLTSVKKFVDSEKEHIFMGDDLQRFISVKDMVEINPEEYFGGK